MNKHTIINNMASFLILTCLISVNHSKSQSVNNPQYQYKIQNNDSTINEKLTKKYGGTALGRLLSKFTKGKMTLEQFKTFEQEIKHKISNNDDKIIEDLQQLGTIEGIITPNKKNAIQRYLISIMLLILPFITEKFTPPLKLLENKYIFCVYSGLFSLILYKGVKEIGTILYNYYQDCDKTSYNSEDIIKKSIKVKESTNQDT